MADQISSVTLPNNTTYDIKAIGIPMGQVDSTSTSTAFTATVSGITSLYDGVCMWLRNGVVASESGFTIDINNLGAKPVYFGNATSTRCTTHYGKAYTTLFIYNESRVTGGCWDFVAGYDTNSTYTPQSLGFGYGTCDTAAATAAKVVTLASYGLITNGIVSVKFTYAVPASATMNINSKGAKAIYYKGAAITSGVIKAGDVATFIYNGTNYILLAIDRWGTDLDNKLEKTTYEWNREVSFGSSGYLKIGSFPMYDTNITISINSTAGTKTYHGTIIVGTQNVSTSSIGSVHNVHVYDDPSGVIANSLRVVWTNGSRNYDIYFIPATWSKNLIHIQALGMYMSGATDICISESGDPPETTSGLEPVNILGTASKKDVPSSGNASSTQVVMGNDTRLSDSRTPTSHTHGNIQNDGSLQTNDVAIASGDKIVVTDSSSSGKIARTSVSFDGSTSGKCLTQKGTWESFTNNTGTVTSVKVGTTSYDPSSGVVSLPAYPATLPASDTTSTYSRTGTAPVNGMAVSQAVETYRNTIPSGDDLDDYTDCGTYYCSSAASVVCSEYNESTVALSTKIFGLTEFYLTVIGSLYNNSYPVQIIHPAIGVYEVAAFYVRWYNGANAGYTEWFLFPDMNSIHTDLVGMLTLVYQDMTIKNQSTINLGQTSYTPIAFAQCDTAASTRQKVASIVDNATWTRNVGSIVAVKFANTNTYEATASNHVTLNVNGTGDADIYYNASNANTGTSTNAYGYKNRYSFYMWNGTYWVWLSQGVDNNTTYSTITQAEIEAGTGTGTRVVTPALLKYAINQWVFHSATALANGDDLNNITTLGVYRAATVVIANSISHRPNYSDPTLKAFRLEVTDGSGTSDRQMQKLYVFNVNTGAVEEFFRFHTSSGWGSWYQAALSAVSDYVPT